MPAAPGPLRALLALAAALVALGAWTAGPGARRPAATPVADDAALEVRIDLNRAGVADLETLPGVGAALAARIAERRARQGPFRSVEELRQVPGVRERLIGTLRPYVAVAPVP